MSPVSPVGIVIDTSPSDFLIEMIVCCRIIAVVC